MSLEASPEAQAALNLFHRRELSQGADAPLVYMVHGRAGDAGVMWPFRRVLPSQANIVAPQAFLQDRVGGYSWWDIEAPAAQRKGDVLRAADTLSTFIEKSRQYYELQPPYLIACGFSQGGILLSALLQRMPTFFRCIALLASEVYQLDRVELL